LGVDDSPVVIKKVNYAKKKKKKKISRTNKQHELPKRLVRKLDDKRGQKRLKHCDHLGMRMADARRQLFVLKIK